MWQADQAGPRCRMTVADVPHLRSPGGYRAGRPGPAVGASGGAARVRPQLDRDVCPTGRTDAGRHRSRACRSPSAAREPCRRRDMREVLTPDGSCRLSADPVLAGDMGVVAHASDVGPGVRRSGYTGTNLNRGRAHGCRRLGGAALLLRATREPGGRPGAGPSPVRQCLAQRLPRQRHRSECHRRRSPYLRL